MDVACVELEPGGHRHQVTFGSGLVTPGLEVRGGRGLWH